MRLIKPSFEIIEQKPSINGLLQHIERCARTCYKSEDKITEESAPKFIDMLIHRGHTACLEHGTVYLKCKHDLYANYLTNKYSNVVQCEDAFYITTNYRVLLQNGWLDDLQYQCEPTEHHVKRISVKFTLDRGISHEFVRHRVFSFCQESTRYCSYNKDRFGNECTFIIPSWLDLPEGNIYESEFQTREGITQYSTLKGAKEYVDASPVTEHKLITVAYLNQLMQAEKNYFQLLDGGWIAQQARAVLPNSLKTELVMTGTIEQWKGFFELRDDKQHVHPQAYELVHPLHEEFIARGWIEK